MKVLGSAADPLGHYVEELLAPHLELHLVEPAALVHTIAAGTDPVIALVRPGTLRAAGLQCLRATRRTGIVLLVDEQEAALVQTFLDLGADDVAVIPFDGERLWIRLQVVERALERRAARIDDARRVLRRELDSASTGELVIRGDAASGSIHLDRGHVCWASVSSRRARLIDLLADAGVSVDSETAERVLTAARDERKHLVTVLVDRGLVTAAAATECLRKHVARSIADIVAMPDAVALFVPYESSFSSGVRFPAHDVLPGAPRESGGHVALAPRRQKGRAAAPAEVLRALEIAYELAGCVGVTVVDGESGMLVAALGAAVDAALARSAMRMIGTRARMVSIEDEDVVHIAHKLAGHHVLAATFSSAAVSVGLARQMLKKCNLSAA